MSYTENSLKTMNARAVAGYKATRKLFESLRRMQPQALNKLFHSLHVEQFAKIDCLECANCCKTLSPAIYDTDVRRMARFLRMKESELIDTYLNEDTDGSFIFRSTPCPFLGGDNYCSIYEARPKACREYPHTDRKRMYQILKLTATNTKTCPAVFNISEQIKKQY